MGEIECDHGADRRGGQYVESVSRQRHPGREVEGERIAERVRAVQNHQDGPEGDGGCRIYPAQERVRAVGGDLRRRLYTGQRGVLRVVSHGERVSDDQLGVGNLFESVGYRPEGKFADFVLDDTLAPPS